MAFLNGIQNYDTKPEYLEISFFSRWPIFWAMIPTKMITQSKTLIRILDRRTRNHAKSR